MNTAFNQYSKYLKHLLEVECAEKNLDFDKLFISYLRVQKAKDDNKEREAAEKKRLYEGEEEEKKDEKPAEEPKSEDSKPAEKPAEGEKKDEKPKRGDLEFDDGYYEGETKNGLMHGHGTRYWDENNRKWAGEWSEGKACGHVVVSFGDFIAYDGQMENGLPNGQGVYTDINSGQRYEGNFVDFKREGEGTLYTESGDKIYEGEWKNNKYHGYGMYFLRGQCRYDGLWENGKRNGDGVAYNEKGVEEYNGPWKDDVRLNDIDRIKVASKG